MKYLLHKSLYLWRGYDFLLPSCRLRRSDCNGMAMATEIVVIVRPLNHMNWKQSCQWLHRHRIGLGRDQIFAEKLHVG
eukprot:scaffold37787_cov153-Skeletonema_marinoi.AAC.6